MDLLRRLRSRKYLLSLLFSIMFVMAALLLLSSSVLYYQMERTAIQIQYDANKKVLHQVNYNIDSMSEITKNLAISLFFDPDTINLMNTGELEPFDMYPKLYRLDKLLSTNSYLDSIIIYNATNGCYYGTAVSGSCGEDDMTRAMDSYLEKEKFSPPKLKFVPFHMAPTQNNESIDFFSYFMYETTSNEGKRGPILIINVKPEWLTNQINILNELTETTGDLFIVDEGGQVLISDPDRKSALGEERDRIFKQIPKENGQYGNFLYGKGKNKIIITYMSSAVNNWTIVALQPYGEVIGKIQQMRIFSVLIIVFFLILSISLSLYLAHRLYRPVKTTLTQVMQASSEEEDYLLGDKDELSLIATHFSKTMEGMKMLKQQQAAKKDTLKTFFLRKLITDSSSVSKEEVEEYEQDRHSHITLNERMLIILLKIDDYDTLCLECTNNEMRLYNFAIGNIAGEVISRRFRTEIVDLRGDYLIMIVNGELEKSGSKEELMLLIGEAQETVKKMYKITFSASIGDEDTHYQGLSQQHGKVLDYMEYRILYGPSAIITYDMIRNNLESTNYTFSEEKGKRLAEGLKTNDLSQQEASLDELFEEMYQLRYDYILHWLLHLIALVSNTVREINNHSLQQITFDLTQFHQKLMVVQLLDHKKQVFKEYLKELHDSRNDASEDQRYIVLVETIKEHIEDQYSDVNLSLQSISSMMKMSTGQISRVFRAREKLTVNEYINDVRLRHAIDLLGNNSIAINEIVDRVGFGTQSYFYRLFKRKYGTTPKEYRLKRQFASL